MNSNGKLMGSGFTNAILAFVGGAVAWAIFGPKIKQRMNENQEWQNFKLEVDNRVSEVRDMTREQYDRIVDEVSDKYSKVKGIRQNEMREMANDLKKHWHKIKQAWNAPPPNQPQLSTTNEEDPSTYNRQF